MQPDSNSYSLLQEDAVTALSYGLLFQFCSSLVDDVLTNPFHLAYAQAGLYSIFEMIYSFSPATASKTVTTEIALYLKYSQSVSVSLGDATYVAIMLAQDTTPFGMLRSTTALLGKTIGYKVGFWAEKKLFSMRDTIQLHLNNLAP